jgi:glutathione S-transferase
VLTIYHSPGRRSVRPIWLCYELELPVAVQLIDYSATYRASAEWRAISPAGKVPAMRDGELVMFESGAMVDYLLERYGAGRLQPERGTAASALHHQWCWFAESTLLRPLGAMRVLRARRNPETLVDDAEQKIAECLEVVESALQCGEYLLGDAFGAADIMLGYALGLLESLFDGRYPRCREYLGRLQARPAYQRVAALGQD